MKNKFRLIFFALVAFTAGMIISPFYPWYREMYFSLGFAVLGFALGYAFRASREE